MNSVHPVPAFGAPTANAVVTRPPVEQPAAMVYVYSIPFPLTLGAHAARLKGDTRTVHDTDVCVGQRPLIIYSQLRPNLHAIESSLQRDHRGLARSRRPQGLWPRGLGAWRRGRLVLLHYVPLLLSRSGRQMTARLA